MRYDSYDYQIDVFMRHGEAFVYDTPSNFAPVASLDPFLIGKAIRDYATPELDVGPHDRTHTWDSDAYLVVVGAPNLRDLVRSSARIQIKSDGNEARFRIIQPIRNEHNAYPECYSTMSRPLLSSLPPIWDPREKFEGDDNPLLIAPWHDPEMLGQGILEAFRLAGPPFIEGLQTVFDSPEPKRRLALHRASRDGDVSALPPVGRRSRRKLDPVDMSGATPLMLAAQNGHVQVLRHLLELGADARIRDDRGRAALHYAAETGRVCVVRELIARGADWQCADSFGDTVLHLAAANGHSVVVELLLDAGAPPNVHDSVFGSTPLHKSARGGHTDAAELLLSRGANPDAGNDLGRSALHVAAAYGSAQVVGALLESGASANLRDNNGETPLHRPAFFQHLDCIASLIQKGADVNVQDRRGNAPLHVAASMNRDKAAALLIDAGARLETRNREGLTPLDMAVVNLHSYSVHSHLVDSEIVYMVAHSEHNSEVLRALLQRGATIDPMRIPVGDRHILWPHLTPPELMRDYGDLDYTRLPELSHLPYGQRKRLYELNDFDLPPLSNAMEYPSILHDAVVKDVPDVVRALVDSGASPQTSVRLRMPPLHFAVVLDNTEMAEILLDAGADIEAPECNAPDGRYETQRIGRHDERMETALDAAVRRGQVEMARFLLGRGARPYPPDTREVLMAWKESVSAQPLEDPTVWRILNTFYPTELIGQCPADSLEEMKGVFREFGLSTETDRV